MKKIVSLLGVFIVLVMSNIYIHAEGKNIINNPGFEEGGMDGPYYWTSTCWNTKENMAKFSLDTTQQHSGKNSIKIQNLFPNHSRYEQSVKVKPNTIYKLSCFVKTEKINETNKGANISVEDVLETSNDVVGTSGDWKYLELFGKTGSSQEKLSIMLAIGGYGSTNTGTAWFDDAYIEELSTAPSDKKIISLNKEGGNALNASDNQKSKFNMLWLLGILFIIIIGVIIFYITKKNHQGSNEREGIANIRNTNIDLNVTKIKFDKKDIIIMVVMTGIYLAIALINLGTLSFPKSSWTPENTGETFTIEFEKNIDLSKISVNWGFGVGRDSNGKYRIQYQNAVGNFIDLTSLSKMDNDRNKMFIWDIKNISATKINKLKFIVEIPGGTINELGIFEGNNNLVKNFKIIEKNSSKGVEKLFDEQETVDFRSTYLNSMYFDEIYHARTAYEYLHNIEPYENTHPPLGKILISIGIMIFGMVPFGWRIMGTLFGAAMIPAMYVFGKKAFHERFYAFCAAFLMMFDFMHFSQTRIATIDVYVTFFIILMYYFMYQYYMSKSYEIGLKSSLMLLFLCGLSFGLGVASKWIALYGALGLATLLGYHKLSEYNEYLKTLKMKKSKQPIWTKNYISTYIGKTVMFSVIFFVIIPGLIYILSYIPYMLIPDANYGPGIAYKNSIDMYNYHKNLVATHPYQSKWWEWPLMIKPLGFYAAEGNTSSMKSVIYTFGNPAVWWGGVIAAVIAAFIAINKKNRKELTVFFVAIIFQYIPWILIPRIAFIYHYFSIVPFIILLIVYVFKKLIGKVPNARYLVYGYLILVAVLFIAFYPVLSGMETSKSYIEYLKWGKNWYF